ncbi:exosortase A [Pseudomaricurvus alcaniphilus]|uniref:exosortase A n=1 Tax=Pseudomaricurvus alcaniphilus TaxID=1166482 RepID=UPI001407598D|nr:exosortase A [Pseudomaricurvus alcaniphilus]NHN36731.1 exosortase A [Pseudomaricurvus alcaniphilus]
MVSLSWTRLKLGGGLVVFLWLAAIALLWDTYLGIIDLWSRSDTYTHGYIVLPTTIYLVWRARARWLKVAVKPQPLALLFVAGCLGAWLLGAVAGVQALEHLAAICLLPLLVWSVMGNAFTQVILFPLCFLVFAAPIGDFLIDPMMAFTADFTVATIRSLGIPVYREGLYFSLPSGDWSVVKACSGIRYIIASLTLGALYSYLTYTRYWKRAVFILFAALMPVLANGLRAVIIVLIGHFSNMELATGADHLVYGWVFFGIVIFAMFWIGNFFADAPENSEAGSPQAKVGPPVRTQVTWAFAALAVIIGFRGWQEGVQVEPGQTEFSRLVLPQQVDQWQLGLPLLEQWQPRYFNPAQTLHGAYRLGTDQVGLYCAYFPYQNENSELTSSVNNLAGVDRQWRVMSISTRPINGFDVIETVLRGRDSEWLMWSWYQGAHGATSSRVNAKLHEVWGILTGRGSAGAGFVVYHKVDPDRQAAAKVLAKFMESLAPQVAQQPAGQLFERDGIERVGINSEVDR